MRRGFPGKVEGDAAAMTALRTLLLQARTLDHLTPDSLVRSYGLPLATVEKLIRDAKIARLR